MELCIFGIIKIYQVENLEINIREELGVRQQLLNPKEIHDLEPNIKPIYDGGVFYSYAKHTNNPRRLHSSCLIYFYKKGENFINIKLKDINFDEDKNQF